MGKVKTVTSDKVAEYVAERQALGSEVKTEEQVAQVDKVIAGQPVKPAEAQPPITPVESRPPEANKGKNSVQDRIDELTRQKKEALEKVSELEEFGVTEYEARLQAQRQVSALQAQLDALQSPPKPEVKQPKPTDKTYQKEDGTVDQDKFLEDWGKWNRDKAIEDYEAKQAKQREEANKQAFIIETEERRQRSIEAARKEFPDYDEKIEEARQSVQMKKLESPNENVDALLKISEYGAHILYHLSQHPEDVAKWNKMIPAQIAIAIGRLETTFAKPVEAASMTATGTPQPFKPNLPEPTPSLGAGGGVLSVDLTQPTDFKVYKQHRLDEIRKKRRG